MKKAKDNTLISALKAGVMAVLNDPEATPGEKLKAIEAGAKLLAVEHKIGAGKTDDPFFSN